MRFPSVTDALSRARETAIRFPLTLAAGVVAAAMAMVAVELPEPEAFRYLRAVLAALTGLPLLIAITLYTERRGWPRGRALALGLAALVVPIGFFVLSAGWTMILLFTRFFHLVAGLHLLVAFLPFLGVPGENGFWQYNRTFFLRFLISALFSVVLYAGLSLALVALDQLFGVDVEPTVYPQLMFLIAFVFNTWFFLGGVPEDLAALEDRREYPAGLRVFTQFVLIPLVAVYLLILTAYLARVLITREWPSGWIGWLVSSVAVAGTLALLLVHPLRERKEYGWINAYGRWFYVVLLPSVGMLLAAIAQRVGQYGFTERRYFLLVLALYLGGIALYFGITGSRRIRMIPLLLALVAFVTLVGPWSAYNVSRHSQLDRVEAAFSRNEMLANGIARPATADVPLADRGEISGALEYLISTHGPRSIEPLVGAELARGSGELEGRGAVDHAVDVMESLGLEYVSRWQVGGSQRIYFTSRIDSTALAIDGYERLLQVDLTEPDTLVLAPDTFAFRMDSASLVVTVSRNGQAILLLDLAAQIDRLSGEGSPFGSPVPADRMVFDVEGDGASARVVLQHVAGTRDDDGDRLGVARAMLLLRFD